MLQHYQVGFYETIKYDEDTASLSLYSPSKFLLKEFISRPLPEVDSLHILTGYRCAKEILTDTYTTADLLPALSEQDFVIIHTPELVANSKTTSLCTDNVIQ